MLNDLEIAQPSIANYRFGERVTFQLKGAEEEGTIVYAFRTGKNITAYHIRDDYGQYWHREGAEIREGNPARMA